MKIPDGLLLGVDLGTSSVKAVLTAGDGQTLVAGNAEYPIIQAKPGYAEQDPNAWWQAVCQAVRMAVESAGSSARIAAVGLSGQMHGTVLLNGQNEVLAPAIIWADQRSARQVQEITMRAGLERLTALAGSPVATGFQAATLLWVRQERPDLWRQIEHVLLPKDYVRQRMTGDLATEPSDASGALLLDVRRRAWSAELLSLLEIEPAWLPPLQAARAIAGRLQAQAAAELGLPAGLPVVTGAADTACSALGAGVVEPGEMLLTLSSGGQLLQPLTEVRVDPLGRVHTFCSALEPEEGAGWYQMGAILAAGLALRWLRDNVLGLTGADAYERMTAWAGETPPGSGGLLFLPYLSGERTPHMNPEARGALVGLTGRHGRREIARAVLEGVTLACYDAYSVLAELGAHPAAVVLAGGGAASRVWQRIVADVFGLPVRPLAVSEQSALGAAILAGAGLDWLDAAEAARAWACYGDETEPDPTRHAFYQDAFGAFRTAYANNAALFGALGRLVSA